MVLAQAERREDDTIVGILNSFPNWKKQEIYVIKGSKGYKVIVPIFKKVEDSKPNEDKKEKTLTYFKTGNVFDISQTSEYENYKKELQEIDRVIMKNSEIDYNTALDFTKTNFPEVKIIEDFKDQEKKGGYDPLSKDIILYEKSSHTIFHEIGHHVSISILNVAGHITKDYVKNEVIAELISFPLLQKFDEEIIKNYNFKYSNVWANRITNIFELEEFEKIFKIITNYLPNLKVNRQNE